MGSNLGDDAAKNCQQRIPSYSQALTFRNAFARAPFLQQNLTAAGITLVDDLHIADAVGAEMPEAIA